MSPEKYGNGFHRSSPLGFFKNLVKSALRFFYRSDIQPKSLYLNLGCGSTIIPGWHNADYYTPLYFKYRFDQMDITRRIRYPDNSFQGIFCEHVLEHIHPQDLPAVLKEIYRVLKVGGRLRVSVPDLGKYVAYYCNRDVDEMFKKLFPRRAEAIWGLTQNWNHLNVFDYELLHDFLAAEGFDSIGEYSYMDGRDHFLLRDAPGRSWESLYVECVKA